MQARLPCRVQWVTRPEQMQELVEKLVAVGGVLIARSGYDVATDDLDAVANAETGRNCCGNNATREERNSSPKVVPQGECRCGVGA